MRCVINVCCAGSWILTSAQCARLRAVQDRMLRKMIYVPRLPDESEETHMTRWARLLRNCSAKYKLPRGDETYFGSYFSWCGHIARITTRDPKRETSKLFLHKNNAWLRSLKKETGTQCHGTPFQSLEVGAGRESMSWRRVGKDGTKQYGMALQVGKLINWNGRPHVCFKLSDSIMTSLHVASGHTSASKRGSKFCGALGPLRVSPKPLG